MSHRFYFGGPSDSDDDNDALPYPEPLARNAFLTPNFTPTDFLSSLHNRHQTLEDLRSELRTRSQELSKELLDLVNDNYEEFLGLGNDLRGGEEKVEEVRVGLLGFKREIDALREQTEARREEVEGHVAERQDIIKNLQTGKILLEIDAHLEDLERSLGVSPQTNGNNEKDSKDHDPELSDESESEAEDEVPIIPMSRIRRRTQQYSDITRLIKRVGQQHPFLVAQESRLSKIRQVLLMDLANIVRQCRSSQHQAKTLEVLKLYQNIGEAKEAIKVMRARTRP